MCSYLFACLTCSWWLLITCYLWREASPSMRSISPIYFYSQLVTNLIRVLVSCGLSSGTYMNKNWRSSQNHVKVPWITSRPISYKLFEIIILPFKYSLIILAAPLFMNNVLLLINFKRFYPFVCRGNTVMSIYRTTTLI